MKSIGIVDITTVGACICANEIVTEYIKRYQNAMHPEFTIHAFPFEIYKQLVLARDWETLADKILLSIDKLHKIDCDFVIIPSNTPHYAIDTIIKRSPLPVLNMLELAAEECVVQRYKTSAVLGTKMTMQDGLYNEYLTAQGIQAIYPNEEGCDLIQELIMDYIIPLKESRFLFAENVFSKVIASMKCDAVILGCTELPEVYTSENLHKPVIDTTRLLAHKALEFAME